MSIEGKGSRLRIVAFMAVPRAAGEIVAWAAARGHRLVLVVTTPNFDAGRYGGGHLEFFAALPPEQDVLLTTRMKTVVAPVVRALEPDLIIAAGFPRKIPPEVTALPKLGAYNIHPAPLPRYRGPNSSRGLYDGEPELVFTFHELAPEIDAGAIVAQVSRPVPDDLTTEGMWQILMELAVEVLDDGVERVMAGERGVPQDECDATYAAMFSEEERWLDWRRPGRTLQRQAVALNFPAGGRARGVIDGQPYQIDWVRPLAGEAACGESGVVVGRGDGVARICAGDGVVEVGLTGIAGAN